MKRAASIISECACALFLAALWSWFFYFSVFIAAPENAYVPVFWPVLLFAFVYAADRFASSKGAGVLFYIALQIVLAAAGSLVLQYVVRLPEASAGIRAYMAVFFAITTAICAKTCINGPSQPALMHRFDIALILAAVMLLADHFIPQSAMPQCLAALIASMVFSLLALTALRSEKNSASGSAFAGGIPLLLLVLAAVLAGAAAVFLSGGAGSITAAVIAAVSWVFSSIARGAAFLWAQWSRFCAWIGTLLPKGEPGEAYNVLPDDPVDIQPAGEPSQASIVVLYVLTALMALGLLTFMILKLRKVRIRRRTAKVFFEKDAVRTGDGSSALKKAVKDLLERIRYRAYCIRFRNTPAGLLAWCERKAGRKAARAASESGSSFLRRLAVQCAEEEKQALLRLAQLVERSFYSSSSVKADAGLCRAVRRCRF